MRNRNLFKMFFLSLLIISLTGCNDNNGDRWYHSMEDGGPFYAGHVLRFYHIDGEGNDLIDPDDPTTLPISSTTLLSTPPETPTDFEANGYYNNRQNLIQYDEVEKLNSFFTYAYGDSRYSDYTFYVYFNGEADVMDLTHRYQNTIMGDGDYLSDVVSWKVNGEQVYELGEKVYRKKVFICKTEDGKTTILFENIR